jgi:hypothetical protein
MCAVHCISPNTHDIFPYLFSVSCTYRLVEAQLSAFAVSVTQALGLVGLSDEVLQQLRSWSAGGSAVTLRFTRESRCLFVREVTREVESPNKSVSEWSQGGRPVETYSHRIVTTVTDYYWSWGGSWSLSAFRGVGVENADVLTLCSRDTLLAELKTSSRAAPHDEKTEYPNEEVRINWLLDCFAGAGAGSARVHIDRARASCATPRRNAEVNAAQRFCSELSQFLGSASTFVVETLPAIAREAEPARRVDYDRFNISESAFLPAVVYERRETADGVALAAAAPVLAAVPQHTQLVAPPATPLRAASPLLDVASLNRLLDEAGSALRARSAALSAELPPAAVFSGPEAAFVVAFSYIIKAIEHACDGIGYVENMLRDQVIAAVGKVLQVRAPCVRCRPFCSHRLLLFFLVPLASRILI